MQPYEIGSKFLSVVSATTSSPPANTPQQETTYLVPSGATGAWADSDDMLAIYRSGVWKYIRPINGLTVLSEDTCILYSYCGGNWISLASAKIVFDETGVGAGSLWYYDTVTSSWKNTASALVYDSVTGTLKSAADASAATSIPRLSQLTTADANKGADLIGYVNTTSGLTAALVSDAIDELAARKSFTHSAYRSGSFSDGQMIRLYLNTTDNDANFVIPAGQTLKVLAAYGRCKSGSTAGTTTWTLGIRTWATQAHSGLNDHVLATGNTTSTNSYINIEAQGTLATPLASIVGDDDPVGMCSIQHDNTGGGSSASDKHTIMVYGEFV